MTYSNHRTGRACLAATLILALLAAPAAWAAPPASQGVTGWLSQLWTVVTAWIAPGDSGPTMDPSGLTTSAAETTPQPWEPVPVDPSATDSSNEDDESGPTADPNG